nr:hypothetical protein BaRGS_006781 [Batillaria attramentaria]
MNRKMHLSKVKHSKFNESGQLLVFYAASAIWGADLILREGYVTGISQLWEGYPDEHAALPFIVKFFFIIQEEIPARLQYISLYLVFIVAAFVLKINCLAASCLMQAWLMWNFITFQLRKLRERSVATRKTRSPSKKKPVRAAGDDEINSLPEVDQNSATENGSLRTRAKGKKAQ